MRGRWGAVAHEEEAGRSYMVAAGLAAVKE